MCLSQNGAITGTSGLFVCLSFIIVFFHKWESEKEKIAPNTYQLGSELALIAGP